MEIVTTTKNSNNNTMNREENRFIAEFMGMVKGDINGNYYWESPEKIVGRKIDDLQYHSSWDWLMPVVEKIESLGYTFHICRRRVEIDVDGSVAAFHLITVKAETKIQSVHAGVVTFIKSIKL